VFISVSDADKPGVAELGRQFVELGFEIIATAAPPRSWKRRAQGAADSQAGRGPANAIDFLKNKEIHLVINTPAGRFRGPTR